jgi:hypothetical protein
MVQVVFADQHFADRHSRPLRDDRAQSKGRLGAYGMASPNRFGIPESARIPEGPVFVERALCPGTVVAEKWLNGHFQEGQPFA